MTYFHRFRTTFGSALVAASLAVAGPAAIAQEGPEELTIALSGDFPSLDPSKDTAPIALNYRLNVFEALTQIGKDGSVLPRAAESWEHSDDLLTWTFKLREGMLFHNGEEVEAEDVVWTVERILADDKTPVRNFLKLVETVEALDKYTVQFTVSQPYAIFDRQTKYTYIMSKDYWEEVGDEGYATAPIGSGPYKMVEWVKDDRMVLEQFEDHYGEKSSVKKATFRPIPSEAGRANALLSGEIDIVPELPPSLMPMLEGQEGLTVEAAPGFRVAYLAMDPTQPPFDDPMVREAVDIAIDRNAIADRLMRGSAKASGVMIPPGNEGYEAVFDPVGYDPERAKQLIADSGYDGEEISIDYPNNNVAMANEQAQAIAGYLTEAGLNVTLNSLEFTAFFPLWIQNQLDKMHFFAFGSSQFHAETVLASIFEEGAHNYRADAEMSALIKEQRQEADPERQQELITEAFRLGNADRQYIPLWDLYIVYGAKTEVGYEPYTDGIVRLYAFD